MTTQLDFEARVKSAWNNDTEYQRLKAAAAQRRKELDAAERILAVHEDNILLRVNREMGLPANKLTELECELGEARAGVH